MDEKILDFPQLRQSFEYNCGSKTLQGILIYYGLNIREETVIKKAKTSPDYGTLIKNIEKVLIQYNLKFDSKEMTIKEIENYIDKKIPVLILLQAWGDDIKNYKKSFLNGHWVVVIGYSKEKIYFADPYAYRRTFLYKNELLERWHSKENNKIIRNYGIVVYGKPIFKSHEIIHMD